MGHSLLRGNQAQVVANKFIAFLVAFAAGFAATFAATVHARPIDEVTDSGYITIFVYELSLIHI